MLEFLAFLMVAGGFAIIMGGFVWLASVMRRRGLGGAVMGPLDEVYQPNAHRSRFDLQVQEEAGAPSASADDQHPGAR
ncbi:hypothetical protein Rhe02_01830 [Rhizocola hellebori]|uniref:Uncharacterized protein n=1 Tax=Rhizocola hellebori TaxID=1392758 RepID=A0A8J3Q1X2_9ACTN|nr:hypothetical protein [Rhizocola hellebori]GIH02116.1 hypothetical protein Rhe02_01830 [Rhizocola hellebori]